MFFLKSKHHGTSSRGTPQIFPITDQITQHEEQTEKSAETANVQKSPFSTANMEFERCEFISEQWATQNLTSAKLVGDSFKIK